MNEIESTAAPLLSDIYAHYEFSILLMTQAALRIQSTYILKTLNLFEIEFEIHTLARISSAFPSATASGLISATVSGLNSTVSSASSSSSAK